MRTFSEYINEARQNYIFGGTDDRAPEVSKTFAELEEGDTFYWWSDLATKGKIYEYVLTSKPRSYKKNYMYLPYTDSHSLWIYKDDKYKEFSFNDESKWCIATSVEKLVEVVKDEFDKDIDGFEIERRIFESCNYIFGGTDNRNTDEHAKTFIELKKGDKFYHWREYIKEEVVEYTLSEDVARGYATDKFILSYVSAFNIKRTFAISPEEKNDTIVRGEHNKYCLSTNFSDLAKYIKEKYDISLTENNIVRHEDIF